MSTRNRQAALAVLLLCLFGLSAGGADAVNYSVANRGRVADNASEIIMPADGSPKAPFSGALRLYVVEPESRWDDADGLPYHFATIDIALDTSIALNDGDRYVRSRFWEGTTWAMTEQNAMVIAVLFEGTPHTAYSDPPSGGVFNAYYAEAAAYARPGFCDSNNTSGNSTHTVFIEEGTAVWCPYCPDPNYWLYYVYNQGVLNFIYTALVDDRNSDAQKRLDSYNIIYFPTCYLDGGNQILIGGYTAASYYQNAIAAADSRVVSGANVIVKVTWMGNSDLQVDYAIAKGTPLNTGTANPGPPTGEVEPLIGTPHLYTTGVTDPEGDQMWYQFDWGDGEQSAWQGPYASGDPCSQSHQWAAVGAYDVRVKARDLW
ncbi:MAG TPA: hypothetical protein PKW75_10135, partial [candidate division Zixibacteria bacterium]|nr:hypothetical protein [candidate division Zixibacteria bacterium]